MITSMHPPIPLRQLHPNRLVARQYEEKVCDERDLCSPAEFIQRKLQSALPERQIPVSVLRMERMVRR